MAFDIHQQVFDEDGEYFEKAAFRYRRELEELSISEIGNNCHNCHFLVFIMEFQLAEFDRN